MTVMAKRTPSNRIADRPSEDSIALELDALVNHPEPNVDAIIRKTGQYNRLRGRSVKLAILAALKQKGRKNVDELLGRHPE